MSLTMNKKKHEEAVRSWDLPIRHATCWCPLSVDYAQRQNEKDSVCEAKLVVDESTRPVPRAA